MKESRGFIFQPRPVKISGDNLKMELKKWGIFWENTPPLWRSGKSLTGRTGFAFDRISQKEPVQLRRIRTVCTPSQPKRRFNEAPWLRCYLLQQHRPPPSPTSAILILSTAFAPPHTHTPWLTTPGAGLLECIFNSATLKWRSGKCTQSIINEIISLRY